MGLFDRQRLFRGERLTNAYAEHERFILVDLGVVSEGNTELIPGSTVDKTELITVGLSNGKATDYALTSTLSGPIRDIAYQNVRDKKTGKPKADDLPAVVSWARVDTKNAYDNQATVLNMHEPFTGTLPSTPMPAFSFPPVTIEDNPL